MKPLKLISDFRATFEMRNHWVAPLPGKSMTGLERVRMMAQRAHRKNSLLQRVADLFKETLYCQP